MVMMMMMMTHKHLIGCFFDMHRLLVLWISKNGFDSVKMSRYLDIVIYLVPTLSLFFSRPCVLPQIMITKTQQ